MARKNQPIRVNYYSKRGELVAAAYELWLRATSIPPLKCSPEAESLQILHERCFRALLLDDLAAFIPERAEKMAGAILDAVEAHKTAAGILPHDLDTRLARGHLDIARLSDRLHDAEIALALLGAADALATAVLRYSLPLAAAIAVTDDREPAEAQDAAA